MLRFLYYSISHIVPIKKNFLSIFVKQDGAISGGEKRDYVIQELVETERNYSDVLNSLLKHFARPLSSLLRPEDSARIFFGIKELAEIHAGFHSQLRKARTGAALAQVFLDWREKFLIYGDYCANLTLAQNTLQEACARYELVNQEVIVCLKTSVFNIYDILCVLFLMKVVIAEMSTRSK